MKKRNRLLVFLKDDRKKSIFKMLYESIYLWITKREVPFYYFKFLYRKNATNYKDYISTKEGHRIQFKDVFHKLEHTTIISNKLIFSIYCKSHNLPIPELISYNLNNNFFYNGEVRLVKNEEDLFNFFNFIFNNYKKDNIFIKPLSLHSGIGCVRLNRGNLKSDIRKCSKFVIGNGYIHEENIIQHPKVNIMHGGCINTLRIETFIDKNNKTHLLSAYMRFGIGKSVVDNAHSGGCFVGVNMETGTLKNIAHQNMEYGGAELIEHPDSKVVFGGFKVPLFKEACNLALNAVNYIPDRYIGWDIAITINGPVLIEANEYPDISTSDVAFGGYKKHPLYKGILEEIS